MELNQICETNLLQKILLKLMFVSLRILVSLPHLGVVLYLHDICVVQAHVYKHFNALFEQSPVHLLSVSVLTDQMEQSSS